jgi:predicted TIM-barrel fold metal-dependent hydrolase
MGYKQSTRELLNDVPVIDSHVHFKNKFETYGYDAIQYIYYCSYTNTLSGFIPKETIETIEGQTASLQEKYAALLSLDKTIFNMVSWKHIRSILSQWGVDTPDATAFQAVVDAYEKRKADGGIRPLQIKAAISNSAGHPLHGYVRGLRDYFDGKAPSGENVFVNPLISGLHCVRTREEIEDIAFVAQKSVETLQELLDATEIVLKECIRAGAVGFKDAYMYFRPWEIRIAAENEAKADFDRIMKRNESTGALRDFLFLKVYEIAEALALPMAVHTGFIMTTSENAKYLSEFFKIIKAFPKMPFDLYHLNYPALEDYLVMMKSFPNVYANCAWVCGTDANYITRFFEEAISLLPAERVIYFGSDSHCEGEPVLAALEYALDVLGSFLDSSVRRGTLSPSDAEAIGRIWLYDSAKNLYRLP